MTDSVMWIIPEAPAPQTAQAGVRRFAAGALRFGILDNNKSNADRLLAMIVGVGIPWFLWCLPEVVITAVLINVGRESLRTKIRSTITRRLEAGQPV